MPPTLGSPRGLAHAFRCRSACGLDRVSGRAQLMRGDMGDNPGLPGRIRGMPSRPTQLPSRPHRMPARRASLHHRHLATHPGPRILDRLTRPRVSGPSRLEQAQNVLRARGSPQSQKVVIGIGESPTTTDRHETKIPHLRENHDVHSLLRAAVRRLPAVCPGDRSAAWPTNALHTRECRSSLHLDSERTTAETQRNLTGLPRGLDGTCLIVGLSTRRPAESVTRSRRCRPGGRLDQGAR